MLSRIFIGPRASSALIRGLEGRRPQTCWGWGPAGHRHVEFGRVRFRGSRHAGAAAGAAGDLLAAAADPAAAAADPLPRDPPVDRPRAQRADADEDALVAAAAASAAGDRADPRRGAAAAQSASRAAGQGTTP